MFSGGMSAWSSTVTDLNFPAGGHSGISVSSVEDN